MYSAGRYCDFEYLKKNKKHFSEVCVLVVKNSTK